MKKGVWLYIFPILIAPLSYFNRIIISNNLSVSDVGIFYSIIGLFTILSMYNDLGFSEALNFFIPKFLVEKQYDKVKTTIYSTFILQFLTSALVSTALYFGADFLAIHYFHAAEAVNIIKIFIIYFICLNFFQSLQFIFIVFQDTLRNKFIDYIQALLIFILILIIWRWWFDNQIMYYSFAWCLGIFGATSIGFLVFFKKYLHVINLGKFIFIKKDYFKIQKFAIWSLVWMNLSFLLLNLDQQLTIYLLWPEKAWYYANSTLFFNILNVFIWPFMWFMYPLAAELIAKNQHDKINFLINFLQKYYWAFSIFTSFFFFVFAEILIKIFLGDKFLISGDILRRSILFLYFNIILNLYQNFLSGMWKVKERVNVMIWWLIFNLISILILSKIFDIYGIALANWLTNLFIFALFLYYFTKLNIKIYIDKKFLIKNIVYCLLFWIFSRFFLLDKLSTVSSRLILLLYFCIIWIIYCIWMWIINLQELRLFFYEIQKMRKK